jgi:capsular polysaccharide biosynthesis protein
LELSFCDVQQWLSLGDRRIPCDLVPYQVSDMAGHAVTLTPFMTECRDLTILGADWLPIRPDGVMLLEQMVHTPAFYPDKARNVKFQEGRWVANCGEITEFREDAILIGSDGNYYHWLIIWLPRLLMAMKYADISGLGIVVSKALKSFERETLALLGVDHQLLAVGVDEVIRPRQTLVPSLLVANTVVHPAVPKLLQDAFPRRRVSSCKRVYLSRQDAETRKLTNEAELTALLQRYGFERHVPAQLSFQEQIDLCYGAEALVAVHGAAMTSSVFCPVTAKVFEIYTPHHRATFFYMLSRASKREHLFVPARNVTFGADGNALYGTWAVDLDAMEAALKSNLQ